MTRETELEMLDAVRGRTTGPVEPVRLKPDDGFCFHCHKGVPCWNACCSGADITLTPYDILRLTRRLNITAKDFLAEYTVPAMWEPAGLPVAKLKMCGEAGEGPCAFVEDEGCSVYDDRPVTCRYYPLGRGTFKTKDAAAEDDFFFLVKESHCQGHVEAKTQSVEEFRAEQGVADYDALNRGWMDILMKMASWKTLGGPYGKDVNTRTKQMFFLVSTDVDGFRRFVFDTRFLQTYDIDDAMTERLKTEDETLLQLGFDWLKLIMFNDSHLKMREDVLHEAIAAARSDMGAM